MLYHMNNSEALLLIDIQDFYFPGGQLALVAPEAAAAKAASLLAYFRREKKTVVHIRHNIEPGGGIHHSVMPLGTEKQLLKQSINAFIGTDLHKYLTEKGINKLVIAGMQTQLCVEAAARAGHDFGYSIRVIADACATRDLIFNDRRVCAADVHAAALASLSGNYAEVIGLNEYLTSVNNEERQPNFGNNQA
ncbi:MAG: isochorismatase family protein [Bacteroidetes bacterium]|nr:isochorismatase family protein [Bacteroidota bacterium]